jgi:uncharacterized membrane protein YfcA
MTEKNTSEGTSNSLAAGIIGGIAASLDCVGVLLLMDIELRPAVMAGVVGAVVGSMVSTVAYRKKKELIDCAHHQMLSRALKQ